jgi:inhibitor of KinA sporulation pathway (predicted exonuclease)
MPTIPLRLLIVDLEATCWERNAPAPSEIIEIGAVAYETHLGVLEEFQTFVKPWLQPQLSFFCTRLTTINQADVDLAPSFPAALDALCDWADPFAPFTLAAWGNYDRNQLRDDCRLHGLTYPFDGYLNLKQAFARIRGVRPCGMKGALHLAGLRLEGTHHRGIDDVNNIARLVDSLVELAGPARVVAAGRAM